jgi:hypothetical protein
MKAARTNIADVVSHEISVYKNIYGDRTLKTFIVNFSSASRGVLAVGNIYN